MVVQTKEQIFLLLHQSQEKLKKFGVKRCGLFGSFLHERQNLQSDIDLLVEFETDKKPMITISTLPFFSKNSLADPLIW
jgi:predicted nucleotidyltransferase